MSKITKTITMKKRIILIIGIIVALFAIWQTVMGEPLFRSMISDWSPQNKITNRLEDSAK